jgi:hypothetical protein
MTPSVSQSSINNDDKEKRDHNGYDEFKDFRLLPFEYLLLVCNSFRRQAHMQTVFRPNFKMRKNEIVSNIKFKYLVGEDKLIQYSLNDKEIEGDYRINHLLNQKLEDRFYDTVPWKIEGQALGNKEAGLVISSDQKQIYNQENNKANFNLKQMNLKDSIMIARNTSQNVGKQTEDFLLDVMKKRQEKHNKIHSKW